MKPYEEIPHTADIAIKVRGKDLKELFENAAFGMFDIIADLEGLGGQISQEITVSAPSKEELLQAWLDELLYKFYTKGIIFFEFTIDSINENALYAKAHGRPVEDNKNRLKTEIKAVTFHNLEIKETYEGSSVEIVFDV